MIFPPLDFYAGIIPESLFFFLECDNLFFAPRAFTPAPPLYSQLNVAILRLLSSRYRSHGPWRANCAPFPYHSLRSVLTDGLSCFPICSGGVIVCPVEPPPRTISKIFPLPLFFPRAVQDCLGFKVPLPRHCVIYRSPPCQGLFPPPPPRPFFWSYLQRLQLCPPC